MKSSPYAGYDIHYMYLRDLDLGELPTSIEVDGHTLILKSEFHISLVCAVRLAPLINKRGSDKVAAEIIEAFDGFVKEQPLTDYELSGELRLVKRDEKKTVIVMAKVPNLDKFFDSLRRKYNVDLPTQPTHITLYTLPPDNIGIGILSDEELRRDSIPVKIPELEKLLRNLK